MPRYDYLCDKCDHIHEVEHKMAEEPEIKCPKCNTPCHKTLLNTRNITTYTRGYGYCDKTGCRRDMNIHTLNTDDPYKQHRTSGEKDYISDKLRKAGKHQKNTKTFT